MGQNFLLDPSLAAQIVSLAEVDQKDMVLEIGAGLGALTIPLSQRAKRVWALEADPALAELLIKEVGLPDNVELVVADALEFPFYDLARSRRMKMKVVGNLPYSISSPMIFRLLEHKDSVSSITLMFQKEVALRLIASPGTKEYGPLTVAAQFSAQISLLRLVSCRCFYPRPKVDSALVRMLPLTRPRMEVEDPEVFHEIVRGAFAHRRKTLENSLALYRPFGLEAKQVGQIVTRTGWSSRRGEELGLEEFAKLADAFSKYLAGDSKTGRISHKRAQTR